MLKQLEKDRKKGEVTLTPRPFVDASLRDLSKEPGTCDGDVSNSRYESHANESDAGKGESSLQYERAIPMQSLEGPHSTDSPT